MEPTITLVQQGSPDVSEEQLLDLGGATTGTFGIAGQGPINVGPLTQQYPDYQELQAALDAACGSMNVFISGLGGGQFRLSFGSSLANQNVETLAVTDNATNGTPGITTIQDGGGGGAVFALDVGDATRPYVSLISTAANVSLSTSGGIATPFTAAELQQALGGYTCTVTGEHPNFTITTASHSEFTGSVENYPE